MKRDFVPDDLLSQFDYLFEERSRVFSKFTGKVMELDEDGTAYIWSNEIESCTEDDPDSWIIATPAQWLRSAVKPNVGDYLICEYFDSSATHALYYGTDNDFETDAEDGKDVVYKNGTAKVTVDRTSGNILAQQGSAELNLTTARASIKFGECELYCNASGIYVTNGIITFNILTHLHPTGVGPSGAPKTGS